jgi:hypothetical protein
MPGRLPRRLHRACQAHAHMRKLCVPLIKQACVLPTSFSPLHQLVYLLSMPGRPPRRLHRACQTHTHKLNRHVCCLLHSLHCINLCICCACQVAHHAASIVYAKPTPGVLEIEPSMAWNPAVLAGRFLCTLACKYEPSMARDLSGLQAGFFVHLHVC